MEPKIVFNMNQWNGMMGDLAQIPYMYSKNLIEALEKFAAMQLNPEAPQPPQAPNAQGMDSRAVPKVRRAK